MDLYQVKREHLYLETLAKDPPTYELRIKALAHKDASSFGFSLGVYVVLIFLQFCFGMYPVLRNQVRDFPFRPINSLAS